MVHFFGRATRIPVIVRHLASGGEMDEEMRQELVSLEYPSAVMLATPFACYHLFQILPLVRDRAKLLEVLRTCRDTACMQRDGWVDPGSPMDLETLMSPPYLWPPFVSEEKDDDFWEVWDYPDPDLVQYSWHYQTARILEGLPEE